MYSIDVERQKKRQTNVGPLLPSLTAFYLT
jgi:hypothetical protein